MKALISFIILYLVCPLSVRGQISISFPEAGVSITDTLVLPLNISFGESDELYGIKTEIEYDTSKFVFLGLYKVNSISDSLLTAINSKDSTIILSFASVHPVKQSGVLTSLILKPKRIGFTDLVIEEVRFDEEDKEFVSDTSSVLISDEFGNTPPFIIQIPDSLVLFAGESIQLSLIELFGDNEDDFGSLEIDISTDSIDLSIDVDPASSTLSLTAPQESGEGVLKVKVTDSGGSELEFSIVVLIKILISNEDEFRKRFRLDQNYPNPFNPSTKISFELPSTSKVTLEVYNLIGNKVATLIDGRLPSGSHSSSFDASNLSSGIYIYRIQVGEFVQTKKMLLIK